MRHLSGDRGREVEDIEKPSISKQKDSNLAISQRRLERHVLIAADENSDPGRYGLIQKGGIGKMFPFVWELAGIDPCFGQADLKEPRDAFVHENGRHAAFGTSLLAASRIDASARSRPIDG